MDDNADDNSQALAAPHGADGLSLEETYADAQERTALAPRLTRDVLASVAAVSRLGPDARLKFFESQHLSHQTLDRLYQTINSVIRFPGRRSMIMLCGPTSVGKSTLFDRIVGGYERIREEAVKANTWNPGRIPVLRVNIPSMGDRPLGFIDIYERILEEAQEPLVEQKRASARAQIWRPRANNSHARERDLRWAVESMIRHRQPAAILLDEMQHLAEHRSSTGLESQLNCLKSLATIPGVTWVLAGSYELLQFHNRNAQLSARTRHLHFPRYKRESDADVEEFCRVVWDLGRLLPLEEPPDLMEHSELLYQYSGGIIGIVKTWLIDALKLAITEQATTLTADHLRQTAYDPSQLKTMLQQALKGETDIAEAQSEVMPEAIQAMLTGSSADLIARLAPAPATAPEPPTKKSPRSASAQRQDTSGSVRRGTTPSNPQVPEAETSTSPKKRRRRVGERNPVRDPATLPDQEQRLPNTPPAGRYRI